MEDRLFKQEFIEENIEEKICFKIQNGDETFIDDIQKEYAYGPYGYKNVIKKILGNSKDATECEHDTISALWEHFTQNPQPPDNLQGYVRITARNMAYKRYNDNKKRSNYTNLDEIDTPSKFDLENDVMARALANEIGKFIRDVSDPLDRKMLIYRWRDRRSIKEIAAITGVNYNTVVTKINRYKGKIAVHLIKRGFFNENNFR